MRNQMTLEQQIEEALRREQNNDHLTTEERSDLIVEFTAHHPEVDLPESVDDAFAHILFNL